MHNKQAKIRGGRGPGFVFFPPKVVRVDGRSRDLFFGCGKNITMHTLYSTLPVKILRRSTQPDNVRGGFPNLLGETKTPTGAEQREMTGTHHLTEELRALGKIFAHVQKELQTTLCFSVLVVLFGSKSWRLRPHIHLYPQPPTRSPKYFKETRKSCCAMSKHAD